MLGSSSANPAELRILTSRDSIALAGAIDGRYPLYPFHQAPYFYCSPVLSSPIACSSLRLHRLCDLALPWPRHSVFSAVQLWASFSLGSFLKPRRAPAGRPSLASSRKLQSAKLQSITTTLMFLTHSQLLAATTRADTSQPLTANTISVMAQFKRFKVCGLGKPSPSIKIQKIPINA